MLKENKNDVAYRHENEAQIPWNKPREVDNLQSSKISQFLTAADGLKRNKDAFSLSSTAQ